MHFEFGCCHFHSCIIKELFQLNDLFIQVYISRANKFVNSLELMVLVGFCYFIRRNDHIHLTLRLNQGIVYLLFVHCACIFSLLFAYIYIHTYGTIQYKQIDNLTLWRNMFVIVVWNIQFTNKSVEPTDRKRERKRKKEKKQLSLYSFAVLVHFKISKF